MTLLPVVARELRVASRKRWNYWGRTVAAGVTMAVGAWFMLLGTEMGMLKLGSALFGVTTGCAMIFAALTGTLFCADTVASERREGTLGLLFLTDLKGYDVLLGKLSASSLGGLFYLVAVVPVMAVAILMGGVSGAEYGRVVVILMSVLLTSLSLGMLASTFTTDSKRASGTSVLFMILLGALFPALAGILYWLADDKVMAETTRDAWVKALVNMTPISAYFGAYDSEYRREPFQFWTGVGFTLGTGGLALLIAARRLPHLWQDQGMGRERRGLMARLDALRWPDEASRQRWRTRMLELGPMVWLTGRFWMRGVTVWAVLGLMAVGFLVLGWVVGKDFYDVGVYYAVSLILHLLMKLWIASEAPRQFHEDRRDGGMELILSTPLTVQEILDGRIRALRWQFEKPVLLVLAVDVVFLVAGLAQRESGRPDEWLLVMLARMFLLVLDAYALAWTGMEAGMKATGTRTTGWPVFKVIGVPWLTVMMFGTLVATSGGGGGMDMPSAIVLWLLLGAGNSVGWLVRARSELTERFRTDGTRRPGEAKARG